MDKSDKKEIEQLLKKWYKSKAEVHFYQLFEIWNSHLSLSNNNNNKATLNYKWMNKRWGTCNSEGQITLNIELIKAPKNCIGYVIVHEVSHLSYLITANHFITYLRNIIQNGEIQNINWNILWCEFPLYCSKLTSSFLRMTESYKPSHEKQF